jgi:hypothetical protein
MRNLLSCFILIIFLLLFVQGCKKSSHLEGEFSVLSYNVAGLPEGLSGSHPLYYMSSISKLLNGNNIVHVQEDFCYHDTLLLYDTHPYRTETSGCVTYGSGLNTFSDYPIRNVVRQAWTDCTSFDCYTPKGFSYSQIDIAPGVTVDFYNVHANAGGSVESIAARRKNMVQLCTYIKTNSEGRAALIFGDVNSRYTREGDTLSALFDLGFQDVWIQLIRNNSIPEVSLTALENCDGNRTNADCERKDKIFYRSSDVLKLNAISYQLDDARFYFNNNDTLPLSDHWPVFAKFSYKVAD